MAVWPNGSKNIPTVSSEFSPNRKNPVTGVVQPHNGIDLVGFDIVCAAMNGTIVFAGYNGAAGNEVRIRYDNSDYDRLLHNRAFIRTGGRVSEGEAIAYQGSTGQSTGNHTHHETHEGRLWNPINPRTWHARHNGGGGSSGGTANIGAGQRTAKTVIKRRSQPTSKSPEAGEPLQPGTVGKFVGWIHGENVEGNNVWYKGTSGHYFWSGGFHEGANGTGLTNLNPVAISGNQRKVGGNSVNGRTAANTGASIAQSLEPGTVGDFKGFVRGETVEGNNVWFVGEHSGNYFWSGAFEGGANTANLKDLTPLTPTTPSVPTGSNQRKVGANGVNGRPQATTSASKAQFLEPGTVADFSGWVRGETVEGNNVWFKGAYAGNYFWSGGFEGGANTSGLADLNSGTGTPTTPSTGLKSNQRKVGANSVNGRSQPNTSVAVVQSLEPGTVADFKGWVTGQSVENNNVWFVGAYAGNYFWSGAFEGGANKSGLNELTVTAPPVTPTPETPSNLNPLNIPVVTPMYPGAKIGLLAPLGDGKRGLKGNPSVVVPNVIDRFIVHWTGGTASQLAYFSRKNERDSCPTWHVLADGTTVEFISPLNKPAATGSEWNWRSVAVEILSGPGSVILPAQFEAVADEMAWTASMEGKTVNGTLFSYKLTREHTIGHNEALPGKTECPGIWLAEVDRLVVRAKEILATKYSTTPKPPVVNPPTTPEEETVSVPKKKLTEFLDWLKSLVK